MTKIAVESIGSWPRSSELIALLKRFKQGDVRAHEVLARAKHDCLEVLALSDSLGEDCVTDGEQSKLSNFADYPLFEQTTNQQSSIALLQFGSRGSVSLPSIQQGPLI